MPLFGGSKREPTTTTAPTTTTNTVPATNNSNRRSFFGSKRDPATSNTVAPATTTNGHGSTGGGLLHRHRDAEDPSISGARQRVLQAEQAERDADRALIQARTAVKAAREHVIRLEKEAAEEARLAKIKQSQAHDISKRAKPLGRHDRI